MSVRVKAVGVEDGNKKKKKSVLVESFKLQAQ